MHHTEITLEEMFERLSFENISKMKLNDEYMAEVDHSSRVVRVGCQSFNFETVDALHTLIHKQK